MFSSRIDLALEARKMMGLERNLAVLQGGNQVEIKQAGQAYINFSSNDYMGLASSAELATAWQEGIRKYGVGSGSSPLVVGFSTAHQQLEEALCGWFNYDRAILFSSGFSANQAVLFSLLEKQDLLIQDKLNHASLMEAGILSPASMKRFKHNDIEHLSTLLSKNKPSLVVTEGVFSMDGDKAPLADIEKMTVQAGSWLMVDDAHGVGILGERGAGSCHLAGIKPSILVVTFGKAFGLSGAAILCDDKLGDYLTQFARHYIYSTSIPPSQAYGLTYASSMLQSQQWRRNKLKELQAIYDTALFNVPGFVQTDTPIKPFMCGSVDSVMALSHYLKNSGFWVTAIRPPTVSVGCCRIRVTLTVNHTPDQIKRLTQHIVQFLEINNKL